MSELSAEHSPGDDKPCLTVTQAMAYAAPTLAVAFLMGPVSIVQGIYAKYFGLGLTTIAGILLAARVFDAVTDPAIGYLSDWYYARKGHRKGLFVVGGIGLILSAALLSAPNGFFVSEPPYTPVTSLYFLLSLLALYLAWTLFEIPHLSWGSDLATDEASKNQLFSLRVLGTTLGGLIFFAVPLLPFFDGQGFTPQTLVWSVIAAAIIMLLTLSLSVRAVPNNTEADNTFPASSRKVQPQQNANHKHTKALSLRKLVAMLLANKPFLVIVTVFFIAGAGGGMLMALVFIFVDSFLDLGEKLPLIYMVAMGVSIVAVAIWNRLGVMLEAKRCLSLGVAVSCLACFGISFLDPDQEYAWLMLIALLACVSSGSIAMNIFIPSLLSGATAYGQWRFGENCASSYFSVFTLIAKGNAAIGGAVGLAVAGYYGFDAAATTHTAEQIFGLRLGIAYIPALTMAVALFLVARVPLNNYRNTIITRRLAILSARSKGQPQTIKTAQSECLN